MGNATARQIGKSIKKLSIRPGDVILVDRNVVAEDMVSEIAAGLQHIGMVEKVMVLFLDDVESVRKISDSEMARLGWVRTGVAKLLKPVRVERAKRDEVDDE